MKDNKNSISGNEIEEEFYEEKTVVEEKRQAIVFYLGTEFYGIEIARLKEVVKVPPITYLPGVSSYVLGVINLRGNILTVIDLKRIFGSGVNQVESSLNRIVVVENNGIEKGILVDKVIGTLDIPIAKIDPPMATLGGPAAEYIEGESEIEGKLLGLLNVDKIILAK
jgi:purine-binding chemotaxis protein CheW